MEFIYPAPGAVLSFPPQMSGEAPGAVFRVAHRRASDVTLWWHLDGSFIGETTFVHQLRLAPEKGTHLLTVVDSNGESISVKFSVI